MRSTAPLSSEPADWPSSHGRICYTSQLRHGGAVPGLAADDVVSMAADGAVAARLPGAIRVQTPQGFRAEPLLAAYEQAETEGFLGTDTASCMERFSALPVRWVPGGAENLKITYPHDLAVAERLLSR